jgi:hypothetical protein
MRPWPLLAAALVGCGHPATVEECEFIVERIVELELRQRNRGSPEVVRQEVDKTKEAVRESTMRQCVGKRVTEAAMDCVRNARTAREIVNDCFDGWR